MSTTGGQGHGYTHIDLGKLLENLNSKKKASMYLLNRKAMIPFLESTDWCVCKFSSKQKRVREARKYRMQDLSTACHAGYSLIALDATDFLSGFRFWSITRNVIMRNVIEVESQYSRNSNGYRSWFSEWCNVSVSCEARLRSSENHHTKTVYDCHSTSSL